MASAGIAKYVCELMFGVTWDNLMICTTQIKFELFSPSRNGRADSLHTSDLQKSRHLQKSRVTERHNRGTKRTLKPQPRPKKKRLFLRLVRLRFSLCAPIVPLRDATFLQMTRLLQVTSTEDMYGLYQTDKQLSLLGTD